MNGNQNTIKTRKVKRTIKRGYTKSAECLSMANCEENEIQSSSVYSESSAHLPLTLTNFSAGDSTSLSITRNRKSTPEVTSQLAFVNKVEPDYKTNRKPNKGRKVLCTRNQTETSKDESILAESTNANFSMPSVSSHGDGIQEKHFDKEETRSDTDTVYNETLESSSYRIMQDANQQSTSLCAPWKTCSDISLPSLPNTSPFHHKLFATFTPTGSLQNVITRQNKHGDQKVLERNVMRNVKNFTGYQRNNRSNRRGNKNRQVDVPVKKLDKSPSLSEMSMSSRSGADQRISQARTQLGNSSFLQVLDSHCYAVFRIWCAQYITGK